MTPVTLLTPASATPGQELSRRVRHLAKMPARDSDRIFWRTHAKRDILRGLIALESGRIAFGDWERLHLSAAIDQFRYGHFESSAEYAQRIMNPEANRKPFAGRFSQDRSLASFRAEYEELAVLASRQEP
jgi:hypothetical protein